MSLGRTALIVASAATVMSMLTFCSASSVAIPQDGGSRSSVTVPSATRLRLPIDDYEPSPAQRTAINDANIALVNACMSRFGFPAALPPERPVEPAALGRRYGITDSIAAERYGYHLTPSERGRANAPAPARVMSQEELLVLTGSPNGRAEAIPSTPGFLSHSGMRIPTGGCTGEAARMLGEDDLFGGATTLADQIAVDAFNQAEADPRVVAVFSAWSTCMSEGGYSFANPFAAAGSVDIHTAAPSKPEIATAVADVACKKATKLVDLFYAVEVAHEHDLIQQNIRQLNRLKGRIARVVEAAAAVLGVDVPQ